MLQMVEFLGVALKAHASDSTVLDLEHLDGIQSIPNVAEKRPFAVQPCEVESHVRTVAQLRSQVHLSDAPPAYQRLSKPWNNVTKIAQELSFFREQCLNVREVSL